MDTRVVQWCVSAVAMGAWGPQLVGVAPVSQCITAISKHPHAHYECKVCSQPFWVSYSCIQNEP